MDPATVDVVISLLAGSGVAVGVVLLLLGLRRLVRPRAHQPVEVIEYEPEAVSVTEEPEPVVEEPAEAEVPEPRTSSENDVEEPEPAAAEVDAAVEEVAAKPLSRKIPA